MSEKPKRDYKKDFREFIDYLKDFVESDNRAALATLRRGLGKDVATSTEMYQYIFPKLRYARDEKSFFLLASLFGSYPKARNTDGNIGASLAKIKNESGSIEKRFVALLNAREEVLHEHLRQIVALLKAKETPINWFELLRGIKFWSDPNRFIQKSWARSFWSSSTDEEIYFEDEINLDETNEGEENND